MILSKFAERLGDFMDDSADNGLTLADKLGCGRNTIYRYLQANRMPSVSMTVLIADYFRCTTDFLLGLEDVNYSCNFPPCPAARMRYFSIQIGKDDEDISLAYGLLEVRD